MIKKFQSLIAKEQSLFLFANIIFSGSTYLVMLFIPYFLNMTKMASFSSVYNALLLLLFFFEFGISISLLRFYQIKKSSYLINSVLQIIIFCLVLILAYSSLAELAMNFFNLNVDTTLFFLAIILQLSWVFAKSNLLSLKGYRYILTLAISILLLRIYGFYALIDSGTFTINEIILSMFIIPFSLTFVYVVFGNIRNIVSIYKKQFGVRLLKIFLVQLMHFIKFSVATYFIGLLYVFASRYLIIYLTDSGNNEVLADMGYAMTFLGIITIASVSFRTYFISRFHLSDKESIYKHLNGLFEQVKPYAFIGLVIATGLSVIVYLIKPNYLTINSSIFVFISVITYFSIFLLSLITLLSRTMKCNLLELKINLLRLFLVIIICHTVLTNHPVIGFLLVNLVMLSFEFYFAKQIIKRINYVK